MDRVAALSLLESSGDPAERLVAARLLYFEGLQADRAALVSARNRETERWTKEALGDAIARLDLVSSFESAARTEEVPGGDEIRLRAFDEAIRVFLHELRPILGDLRDELSRDGPGPSAGVTRELERLARVLNALDNLRQAAGASEAVEYDVSELVRTVTESELGDRAGAIELAGPRALLTVGDPHRIELALRNGIRNALDSMDELGQTGEGRPLLVSWGDSGDELWIVVLDRGVGLPPFFERAFELGLTTKSKSVHSGLGLTIARRAARSLGGDVTLNPREDGGASFEIRWPGSAVIQ